MSILLQKCHFYAGNVNLDKSGDSKNAFLHCGDVLGLYALLLLFVLTCECLTLAIAYMSHWHAAIDNLKHIINDNSNKVAFQLMMS